MRALRRHPIWSTLVVAAAVPVLWCVAEGCARLAPAMAAVSVVFWVSVVSCLAPNRLRSGEKGRGNLWCALGVGLVSPVVAPVLGLVLFLFALPLLPLLILFGIGEDLFLGGLALAFYGPVVPFLSPLSTFPVGIGMGAFVGWLTHGNRS